MLLFNVRAIIEKVSIPLTLFSGISGIGGVIGLFKGVVKLLVFSFNFLAISTFSLCCLAFMCTTHTASERTIDLQRMQVSCPNSLYVMND